MSQEVFDRDQLSVMRLAVDQIMEGSRLNRQEVVHAVFVLASESGEFDAAKLARMARERLGLSVMSEPIS